MIAYNSLQNSSSINFDYVGKRDRVWSLCLINAIFCVGYTEKNVFAKLGCELRLISSDRVEAGFESDLWSDDAEVW